MGSKRRDKHRRHTRSEGAIPAPSAGPSPHGPSRRDSAQTARAAWLDFWLGLIVTALLIGIKIVFEHGDFGRQIEQMTLNLQQIRLARAGTGPLPVAVVDITDLPRQARLGTADNEQVTDRRRLLKVVAAIAGDNPQAIGVDVLFDPPEGGVLTQDEAEFLEFCLTGTNESGRHIATFVGVFDALARAPRPWFGDPRFQPVAAAILVPKPSEDLMTTTMSRGIAIAGTQVSIESMPQKLARLATQAESSDRWLGRWLSSTFPQLVASGRLVGTDHFTSAEFPIDFGSLPRLTGTVLKATASGDVPIEKGSLTGRLVLVGRGETGKTTDVFTVPAQPEPVADVFVHAAATNTLVQAPLFRPTHLGRIVADALAALVPLGIVLSVRLWKVKDADAAASAHRLMRRLTIAMAAAIFVFGYFWIRYTGILWTDYLMVIGALLLHGPLERIGIAGYRLLRGERTTEAQGGHA